MTNLVKGLVLAILLSTIARAQTIVGERFRLSDGPCTLSSSNGSPDKIVLEVCPVLTTPSATNLTLNPNGDLVTDPTGNDILPAVNYDINIGTPQLKYLSLSVGELIAETLVAQDVLATIGGRVLVAPTTLLTADLSSGATSIQVKHNNLASGDRVYLQSSPGGVSQVEFMAVTSSASGSAGAYTYSVTRNLDGTGANTWFAGDAVLNTGTTGDGFIDLYSTSGVLSGSGPTIAGNVRTGTTYNAIAPRWAIGNLNALYGYATDIYGAAFGDPSATNVTVDATNGFRIRSGTDNRFYADTAGNLTLDGDLTVGDDGIIRSANASGFASGSGFWINGGSGGSSTVTVLVVGGGGGGSAYAGGGGGNVIKNSAVPVGVAAYTVTVGGGGAGSSTSVSNRGSTGGSSAFDSITAGGGGGGGGSYQGTGEQGPTSGGSGGGGGASYTVAGSAGTASGASGSGTNASAGGSGAPLTPTVGELHGGGGGGAGGVGGNGSSSTGGAGGSGFADSITGSSVTYGGGGGGGGQTAGASGSGGGGNGGTLGSAGGSNGTANRGGGGGASNSSNGYNGGSGVVIVRIAAASGITATGGSTSSCGSDTCHTFTSSGTFTVTAAPTPPSFRVGNPAGSQIAWDGTTLTITGDGSGLTSIDGGNIQTGSITATQIAAGTITATQIAASTITATQIAASTITGTQIAAGTIDASHISVSSLSAITADLGTVTAGSISGASLYAGGVTIDSGGITLTDSTSLDPSAIKWSGGSGIVANGGNMYLFASTGIFLGNLSVFGLISGTGGYACVNVAGGFYVGAAGCP